MDYLTAWREGHEAGLNLSFQLISKLCQQDFKQASDVVLYIKQLEGDKEFHFKTPKKIEMPKKEEPKIDELSTKEEKFIDRLTNKIAVQNWMWRD